MNKLRKITLPLTIFVLTFLLSLQALAAGSYRYYGKKLNGIDRQAYNAALNQWSKGKSDVTVSAGRAKRYMPGLAEVLAYDNPRLFWLSGCEIRETLSGTSHYLTYRPTEYKKGFYKEKTKFEKKVNAAVKVLKRKTKNKSIAFRARAAHDYLIQNCSYVRSGYDQSAYSAFVKRKTVCAGFAKAYKILCDELGVPCICVSCRIGNEGHMLNLVKISNKWYAVDTTWDENCTSGKKISYRYFLKGLDSYGSFPSSCLYFSLPRLAKTSYKF